MKPDKQSAHHRGDVDHPRVYRPKGRSQVAEGEMFSRKFGFRMKYTRYNRKGETDKVLFE